jgi:hypothetical protein
MSEIQPVKKPWKSVTLWGLVLTLFGLITAGLGQGKPIVDILSDPAVQGAAGSIVTILGIGVAVFGRVRQGDLTVKNATTSGATGVTTTIVADAPVVSTMIPPAPAVVTDIQPPQPSVVAAVVVAPLVEVVAPVVCACGGVCPCHKP